MCRPHVKRNVSYSLRPRTRNMTLAESAKRSLLESPASSPAIVPAEPSRVPVIAARRLMSRPSATNQLPTPQKRAFSAIAQGAACTAATEERDSAADAGSQCCNTTLSTPSPAVASSDSAQAVKTLQPSPAQESSKPAYAPNCKAADDGPSGEEIYRHIVAHCNRVDNGQPSAAEPRELQQTTVPDVAQALRGAKRVVVLTGAGISAESGIPTFRGSDGYWTRGSQNYRSPQEMATWKTFNESPEELWKWYQYRWGVCKRAEPNRAHHAIAEMQKFCETYIVTQNVDGLHSRVGFDASRLCEIHGRFDEMRCDEKMKGACVHGLDLSDPASFSRARATVTKTAQPTSEEEQAYSPVCEACGVRQRPNILWFDEWYNEAFYKEESAMSEARQCDVLLIVGTQLTTRLPVRIVQAAYQNNATIIRIDTQADDGNPMNVVMQHLQGSAGELLPEIVATLRSVKARDVFRTELEALKQSVLRKRAVESGIKSAELDAADDADDTKGALISLLLRGGSTANPCSKQGSVPSQTATKRSDDHQPPAKRARLTPRTIISMA